MSAEIAAVKKLYQSMPAKAAAARKKFGRALTLSEKILVSHVDDFETQVWERGKAQLLLRPTGSLCRTRQPRWRSRQ